MALTDQEISKKDSRVAKNKGSQYTHPLNISEG